MLVVVAGCSTPLPLQKHSGATFEIVQTHFLGSLWNKSLASASIVSQDGGESFVCPGGAIWAFGDSFKGSRAVNGTPHFADGAISCAIALLGKNTNAYPPMFQYLVSSNGDAVSPFEFLPDERPARKYRIWPLGGIYVNGQYYLYYTLIEVFGTGTWDFHGVGAGLGRSKVALGYYQRLQPHGNWRFPVEPTQVVEVGGWLYLFSIQKFNGRQGVGLARVSPAKIEEPNAYEFYSGAGPKFSSRKEAGVCLVSNVPGQVSVAWNPYLKKYLMASSSDPDHPREIRLLEADTPTGPWSPPVARLKVPKYRQGKRVELTYCAYLHPELFQENGRVMNLTYSVILQNAGFDANCEMVEIEIQQQN